MPLVDVSRINVGSQALPRFQLGQQQGLAQQQAQQLSAQQAQEQRLRGQLLGVQQAPVTPQQQLGAPIAQPPITGQQAAPVAPVAPVSAPPAPVQAAPEATRGLTDDQAMRRLTLLNPQAAQDLRGQLGLDTQQKADEASDFAFRIQDMPIEQQNAEIQRRIEDVDARGGISRDTRSLLDIADPNARKEALQNVQIAAMTNKERLEFQRKGETDKFSGKSQVQSSSILPGGLVQLVRKDGTVELVNPSDADEELVKQAEGRGARLQGLRAGERVNAQEASKLSVESFKQLKGVRDGISALDEGIRLLDEGAETGVIAKRFPSFKAATVKLENIQAQLGLNVIQNTTFGALSESELKFALDVALPIGLEGPELKDWMQRKRSAQGKLRDYLEEAAIFLGQPGNSIADFLASKNQQAPAEQAAPTQQAAGIPQDITEDDIAETMRANNMTRQQVLDRLGGQ